MGLVINPEIAILKIIEVLEKLWYCERCGAVFMSGEYCTALRIDANACPVCSKGARFPVLDEKL